jgi:hypothetical protein
VLGAETLSFGPDEGFGFVVHPSEGVLRAVRNLWHTVAECAWSVEIIVPTEPGQTEEAETTDDLRLD